MNNYGGGLELGASNRRLRTCRRQENSPVDCFVNRRRWFTYERVGSIFIYYYSFIGFGGRRFIRMNNF